MDVERGTRWRRDDGEWVERLERHLVQLSSRTNINKVEKKNGLNFESTQYKTQR